MLLELTVAEQRFNAVMEVLREGAPWTHHSHRGHRPHQAAATLRARLSDASCLRCSPSSLT